MSLSSVRPSFNFNFVLLFQSKLNCEVLDENLAFEVRWAVAGESIVLQLVAKLGKIWSYKYLLIRHNRYFIPHLFLSHPSPDLIKSVNSLKGLERFKSGRKTVTARKDSKP